MQAVRLESVWTDRVRYMVVVYTSGRQDTEENILLGVDFPVRRGESWGMAVPIRADGSLLARGFPDVLR